jgi:pimeloyl-ACP methyl ester carboxylesterase
VGVYPLDPRKGHRELTRSALSGDRPSGFSEQVLRREGLHAAFRKDPAGTLSTLRAGILWDFPDAHLFAIAELSFLYGTRGGGRAYYAEATAFAFAFLTRDAAALDPLDPRVRLAADLYNQALARALVDPASGKISLGGAHFALPSGSLELEIRSDQLSWGGYRLVDLTPAVELGVRGLRNRYRTPGIGAALVASLERPSDTEVVSNLVPAGIKVPVTVLLRFEDVVTGLRSGSLRGELEVYASDVATRVSIGARELPLEYEASSALASTLSDERIWQFELAGFFGGDALIRFDQLPGRGLILLHPYQAGQVPVVFVHGTASSPARWADIVNELEHMPYIRKTMQPWLFMYNTGQPIAYSAALLRAGLQDAVETLDPQGLDPALRQMVVVGHSQGGLLAKLIGVSSGDRFWELVSPVPLEETKLDPEARALLRKSLFFEALPFVRRIVFIATPHRGSFLAGGRVSRWISGLVTSPARVTDAVVQLLENNPEVAALNTLGNVPSSIDNMAPDNGFLNALVETPVAPHITTHSIIAISGDGPVEDGNDGVVEYRSAHLEGVASEKIVRSGHSTQSNPETMREIDRILIEHLRERDAERALSPEGFHP